MSAFVAHGLSGCNDLFLEGIHAPDGVVAGNLHDGLSRVVVLIWGEGQSSRMCNNPPMAVITKSAVQRRKKWIEEIARMNGDFNADSRSMQDALSRQIKRRGLPALLEHLRLCSSIPESYGWDSREEKLYSQYTDSLLSETFSFFGLDSTVLTERADAADVEVVGDEYSFVADAKVFRLSRTARNQKDFKVQAMDGWKRGKPWAVVVCPLYQLPSRSSQIYQQAGTLNVCILSYSHLAVLASLVGSESRAKVIDLLHSVFKAVQALNPSKDATDYWQAVNRTILNHGEPVANLWKREKAATVESIKISREMALDYYAAEREAIMRLSRKEALQKLIDMSKIESRMDTIKSVSANLLMDIA